MKIIEPTHKEIMQFLDCCHYSKWHKGQCTCYSREQFKSCYEQDIHCVTKEYCKMKYPPDEQNICLRCRRGYKNGLRYKPDGYDYYITYCGCEKGFLGKNMGHRKTCKYFEEK